MNSWSATLTEAFSYWSGEKSAYKTSKLLVILGVLHENGVDLLSDTASATHFFRWSGDMGSTMAFASCNRYLSWMCSGGSLSFRLISFMVSPLLQKPPFEFVS
jgi:hypothetical protein